MLNSGKIPWRQNKKQEEQIETVREIAVSHRMVKRNFSEKVTFECSPKTIERANYLDKELSREREKY